MKINDKLQIESFKTYKPVFNDQNLELLKLIELYNPKTNKNETYCIIGIVYNLRDNIEIKLHPAENLDDCVRILRQILPIRDVSFDINELK
jgi:hypothetical protein